MNILYLTIIVWLSGTRPLVYKQPQLSELSGSSAAFALGFSPHRACGPTDLATVRHEDEREREHATRTMTPL